MLSLIEMDQQGAEQFPLKSTVVDFKLLFSYSLCIKTWFADKVEGIPIIIVTSPFIQLLQGLLKLATCLMQDWITFLKYSHLNKKKEAERCDCMHLDFKLDLKSLLKDFLCDLRASSNCPYACYYSVVKCRSFSPWVSQITSYLPCIS